MPRQGFASAQVFSEKLVGMKLTGSSCVDTQKSSLVSDHTKSYSIIREATTAEEIREEGTPTTLHGGEEH